MSQRWNPIQVLSCVRSAYVGGVVPGADYPALLSVLRQHLSVDDVARVATELVVRGVDPHTTSDVFAVPVQAIASDVDRVISHLRSAGQPF